jgi:transcription elongation factor GreA-like protein
MRYEFTFGDIDAEVVDDLSTRLPDKLESHLDITKDFARRLALYNVVIELADAAAR